MPSADSTLKIQLPHLRLHVSKEGPFQEPRRKKEAHRQHSMLRKLKPHEERLLRKVDIYDWKREHNIREIKIIRRYHIQKREDYAKSVIPLDSGFIVSHLSLDICGYAVM